MAQAGQIVRAVDFTPPVRAESTDEFEDFSTTDYEPTEPAVEVTFIAPSSGIVRFTVSDRIDADVPNERIRTDIQVRITDAEGTVVHSPTVTDAQGIHVDFPDDGSIRTNWPGWRYLSGLTPGQTYWAQLRHNTAGMDILGQSLTVEGVW